MRKLSLLLVAGALSLSAATAQDFKMPAPSPLAQVSQQFSTSNISFEYSRPSMRGREVFGGLVPYGQVWRTGANSDTKITFGEDVKINGVEVKAGKYALFTMPGKDSWKIMINTNLESWGSSTYKDEDNIATITVPVTNLKYTIETFTIELANITTTSADLQLMWANTAVVAKITADNQQRILSYLQEQLKGEKPPYQQAANYYLDNNIMMNDALIYANKAIDANKEAFYLYWLKARIYNKMGNKKEALDAAGKAASMAKGGPYATEYMNNYENMKKGKM